MPNHPRGYLEPMIVLEYAGVGTAAKIRRL